MRSFRFTVVQAATLGVLVSGCIESGQCPRPLGSYVGSYVPLNGNCTQVKSRNIKIDADKEDSVSDTVITLSDAVTTEVNLIGCTVTVEQSISTAKDKRMIAHIEGNLAVQDASALSGTLNYQEYLPDGTTQACFSQVAVSYTRQGAGGAVTPTGNASTFGAAAEAALASP